MTEITKEDLFHQICEKRPDFSRMSEYPEFGQIVRSGLMQGKDYIFDNAIGYIVQIRKKRGQYGSDQYLVRHPDGSLVVHENQSFWVVDSELGKLALSYFKYPIEEDGTDIEYTIGDGFPETGYIIDFNEGDPVSDSPPFVMSIITTSSKD
jgi:hypothetical protein